MRSPQSLLKEENPQISQPVLTGEEFHSFDHFLWPPHAAALCHWQRSTWLRGGGGQPCLHWLCILSHLLPQTRTWGFSKKRKYVLRRMVVCGRERKVNLCSHLVLLMGFPWVGGFWQSHDSSWRVVKLQPLGYFCLFLFITLPNRHLHFHSQGFSFREQNQ